MENKSTTQTVIITQPLAAEDFKKNPKIRSTRRKLLILLSIQLVLSIIYFITTITDVAQYHRLSNETDPTMLTGLLGVHIVSAALSIIYSIIFLIAAYKYLRIAVLVCAWWTVIELITFVLMIIIAFIQTVVASSVINNNGIMFAALMFLILVGSIAIILPIMITMTSFKLTKLMAKMKAHSIV